MWVVPNHLHMFARAWKQNIGFDGPRKTRTERTGRVGRVVRGIGVNECTSECSISWGYGVAVPGPHRDTVHCLGGRDHTPFSNESVQRCNHGTGALLIICLLIRNPGRVGRHTKVARCISRTDNEQQAKTIS